MGARFIPVPDLKGVIEGLAGVEAEVESRTERIARETMFRSAMASRHPRRYGRVLVRKIGRAAYQAAAQGPLAHLDEWGSANNNPRATMRRAAEREGEFKPEGRR